MPVRPPNGIASEAVEGGGRISTVQKLGERLSVFAFVALVVLAFVALAFAAGYTVGKLLL
jgi:hypothetical protein